MSPGVRSNRPSTRARKSSSAASTPAASVRWLDSWRAEKESEWDSTQGTRVNSCSRAPAAAGLLHNDAIASYSLNQAAVSSARKRIEARQYVLDSEWGDVQPGADAQNAFLESHSWDEYAEWHLGLTDGAADETKARYAFVYGDFRRIHRSGLIACVYRAAEWRHKDVELAAHDLLQLLDRTSG